MRIITISRQFGSGGRQLGKYIAEYRKCDFYDREIVTAIARKSGRNTADVKLALDDESYQHYPRRFSNAFSTYAFNELNQLDLLEIQKEVIQQIGKNNKDCVIVGRNADLILQEYHPFRLFVCSDLSNRVQRCLERSDIENGPDEKEILIQIRHIDKARKKSRSLFTNEAWGNSESYHMTINTAGWDLSLLAKAISNFADSYFSSISSSN